jgi:ABC-type glutathione transport system ATPase component
MPDPDIVMNRYPRQPSGSQQQRVVTGMAMVNRPDLLIMDEPAADLGVSVEAVCEKSCKRNQQMRSASGNSR